MHTHLIVTRRNVYKRIVRMCERETANTTFARIVRHSAQGIVMCECDCYTCDRVCNELDANDIAYDEFIVH